MKRFFEATIPTFLRWPGQIWRLAAPWFSRRILARAAFTIACLATAAAIFYTVELRRWRGKWEHYSAEALASGKRLNVADFVTPPIPDSENFAAIPFFQDFYRDPDAPNPLDVTPATSDFDSSHFPSAHLHPRKEGLFTPEALELWLKKSRKNTPPPEADASRKSAPPLLEALAMVDNRFGPVWRQLQEASARPFCQFPSRWADPMLSSESWPLLRLRSASQWTSFQLQLHAQSGDGPAALEDFRVLMRLADALKIEPGSVCSMIRVVVAGMAVESLWSGLSTGAWDEAQLKEIDVLLSKLDLLATLRFGFESERAHINSVNSMLSNAISAREPLLGKSLLWQCYPNGWIYRSQLLLNEYCDALLESIDLSKHTFDAEAKRAAAMEEGLANSKSVRDLLIRLFISSRLSKLGQYVLPLEATVRQARAAVALQRYRLLHGEYPEKLSALVDTGLLPSPPRDPADNHIMEYQRSAEKGYSLQALEAARLCREVFEIKLEPWQPGPSQFAEAGIILAKPASALSPMN